MNSATPPKIQKKMTMPIGALIQTLKNIQPKIDTAAGAATALELRLRVIAQLEPKVQIALGKKANSQYHKGPLSYLIDVILEVFQDRLDPADQEKIKICRLPRNKVIHGSFAELMIELNGEALGREIDPRTGKHRPLEKIDIIEAAISIDHTQGLEDFSRRANEAIDILERKILLSLKP